MMKRAKKKRVKLPDPIHKQILVVCKEKALGLKAKARTKELLEEVSSKSGYFRIKSYGLGKYGRVLADVYIQDIDGNHIWVNKTLIDEGHAYVYEGGKKKLFENKN